jgi:hypothetical protein
MTRQDSHPSKPKDETKSNKMQLQTMMHDIKNGSRTKVEPNAKKKMHDKKQLL